MKDRCEQAAESAVKLVCYYFIAKGVAVAAIMLFVFWPGV
jgi:hypothetical protein